MSREADRQQLPGSMRRDVRLLGDLLGEVIRESGGQDLLDDVERLRRAVIAARAPRRSPTDGDRRPADEIAALVAGWPLDRAELVARAFTVYFHLTNLAEEQQRVRTLRGAGPGAGAAARVAGRRRGRVRRRTGRAPARRPARPAAGASGAHRPPDRGAPPGGGHRAAADQPTWSTRWTTTGAAPAEQAEVRRRLREEIDLLWRTAPLRVKPIGPIDEVRTVMAVFDETLFSLAPAMYRALDEACRGQAAAARPAAPAVPAFLRFGSWVGADRDGNPLVTAQVTREAAVIQADHVLRALENATTRIGRALTVHADGGAAGRRARARPGGRRDGPPRAAARTWPRARRRSRTGPTCSTWRERLRATRLRQADLAYPGCADFLADLRLVQDVAGRRGRRPGRRSASCRT